MINRVKALLKKLENRVSKNVSLSDEKSSDYFQQARSWADDIYTSTITSRNRYKAAFFSMVGLSALLVICVASLVPIQHTELVVVHEGENGYTWLTTTKPANRLPQDWQRTQSEIAHYVEARESYDPLMYKYQTDEVNLFSTSEVQSQYAASQASSNHFAPINVLGDKGYRTVQVESILPLDSKSKNANGEKDHKNLAQVNYVVTDHFFDNSQTIKTPYSALVSWEYDQVPSNPQIMLANWDGFKITRFLKQPVNTDSNNS